MASNVDRQRLFRDQQRAKGLEACTVWVPSGRCADIRDLADNLKKHPHLTVAMLRDTVSGKLVPVR